MVVGVSGVILANGMHYVVATIILKFLVFISICYNSY